MHLASIIQVPDHFKPMYKTDKPIILLTGGRGSGKSFNSSTYIKRLSYEKHQVILYSRYTMKSASKSVIPEVLEKIEIEGDLTNFQTTKDLILNKFTGSPILFQGIKTSDGNQTAHLKGIQGLSTFVVDEAEEWRSESDYDDLRLSIRSKKVKNRVLIIMNPSDLNHFIYQKYIRNTHEIKIIDGVEVQISTHPQVLHIHTTYLDNLANLSKEFLTEIEDIKNTNPDKYKYKVIGAWRTKFEGAIFNNWEIGEFPDSDIYGYAIDWGMKDPFTLTKIVVDKPNKKLWVKQEVYKSDLNPTDLIQAVESRVKAKNKPIICDSARPDLINMLSRAGFNARPCLPKKKLATINLLQDYRIIVDKHSFEIQDELYKYKWKDRAGEIPEDGNDHSLDAIGYYLRWYDYTY